MSNLTNTLKQQLYNIRNNERRQNKFDYVLYIIALTVCSFLVIHQFFREGLWGDELAVAVHFLEDWKNMFMPLHSHQVAPVLFLVIEKSLFTLANITQTLPDYWLRVYPILCTIGILFLYYPTIKKYTASSTIALFSTLFLIFTPQFLYYTSEIKQYICELFCTILLLYVYSYKTDTIKYTFIFCITVFFSVMTSHMVCFSLLGMGIYDTFLLLRKYKMKIKPMLLASDTHQYIIRYTISLLFLIGYYFCFLINHPTRDFMVNCWHKYFLTTDTLPWLITTNLKYLYINMHYSALFIGLGLLYLLFFNNKFLFIFSICLICSHILFSYFQLYPVYKRMLLYWYAVTALALGSALYGGLKLFLFPVFRKYAGYVVSLCGCAVICFYFTSLDIHVPFYLNRSSNKLFFNRLDNEFKSNDFAVLYVHGYNKYAQRYYYTNKTALKYKEFSYPDEIYTALRELNDVYEPIKDDLNYFNLIQDKNLSNVIAYTMLHPQLQQYSRIWLILFNEKKEDISKSINYMINYTGSKFKISDCHLMVDTTICLLVKGK